MRSFINRWTAGEGDQPQQQPQQQLQQPQQQRQEQEQQKSILFFEWSNQSHDDLHFVLGTNQGFCVHQLAFESTREPYRSHLTEIAQKDFSMTETSSGVGICHLIFEPSSSVNEPLRGKTSPSPSSSSRSRSSSTASGNDDPSMTGTGSVYPRIAVFVGGGAQPVSNGNVVNFFDFQTQRVIRDISFATEVVGISSCVAQLEGGMKVLTLVISLESKVMLYAIPISSSSGGSGSTGGRDKSINLVSQLQRRNVHSFLAKEYPRGSGSRLYDSVLVPSSSGVTFGPNIMETSRSMCKLMTMWEEIDESTRQQFVLLAFPHNEKGKVQIEKFRLVAEHEHGVRLESALSVIFQAHENTIGHIALAPCGKMVATASQKGTRIRVYSINTTPSLLKDYKRGINSANIYSLVFDHNNDYLCCTSDRNTLHVYTLSPEKNQHFQALHNLHGYVTSQRGLLDTLSTYVSDMIQESSIAQFHIPPSVQKLSSTETPIPSIASFHPQNPNIINVLTGDGRLLVLYFNYDLESWMKMAKEYNSFEQLDKPVHTEKHFYFSQESALTSSIRSLPDDNVVRSSTRS